MACQASRLLDRTGAQVHACKGAGSRSTYPQRTASVCMVPVSEQGQDPTPRQRLPTVDHKIARDWDVPRREAAGRTLIQRFKQGCSSRSSPRLVRFPFLEKRAHLRRPPSSEHFRRTTTGCRISPRDPRSTKQGLSGTLPLRALHDCRCTHARVPPTHPSFRNLPRAIGARAATVTPNGSRPILPAPGCDSAPDFLRTRHTDITQRQPTRPPSTVAKAEEYIPPPSNLAPHPPVASSGAIVVARQPGDALGRALAMHLRQGVIITRPRSIQQETQVTVQLSYPSLPRSDLS